VPSRRVRDGQVRLRPVTAADRAFLVELYASVREPELARAPWDAATVRAFVEHQYAAQDAHYREHYPGATFDVVEVDGERAGRLFVHRGASDIRIMDIALLPAFRGRGLGTRLLHTLIEEAERGARKLSIHVEADNPARALYTRLGFRPVGEHGVYVLMERAAVRANDPSPAAV
jgi:ribosomal protein S18 acetylase RimI-like enzyme